MTRLLIRADTVKSTSAGTERFLLQVYKNGAFCAGLIAHSCCEALGSTQRFLSRGYDPDSDAVYVVYVWPNPGPSEVPFVGCKGWRFENGVTPITAVEYRPLPQGTE